jgi:hypothetical protein
VGGTSLFKSAPKASRFNNLAQLGMTKIGEHENGTWAAASCTEARA